VFLKNGNIIEGSIVKRDRYWFVIRDYDGKGHVVSRNKVLRVKRGNAYKEKVRFHTIDGLFIERHLVAETRYVYVLRNKLDEAKEFSVFARHVVRKSVSNNENNKSVAGHKEELLMIGHGDTWDSFYTGLGTSYSIPFGLLGDNFKDSLGINIKFFNSPGRYFYWGIGTGATLFRTVEETQLRNLNSLHVHGDLLQATPFTFSGTDFLFPCMVEADTVYSCWDIMVIPRTMPCQDSLTVTVSLIPAFIIIRQ